MQVGIGHPTDGRLK